jgi:aminoglycoside phosphotransferase (APT) family kinase protein/phosphate uptake regulator
LKSPIPQSIRHNLLFLIAEVSSQINSLQHYILTPSASTITIVSERSGYILNLAVRIHNDSHSYISRHKDSPQNSLAFRAINTIVNSLERIAELCCDCLQHNATIINKECLQANHYQILLEQVLSAIALIDPAIVAKDTQLALKIGSVEHEIKRACDQLIGSYTLSLKNKDGIEDLICAIFMARSVEHIADALLNISEALISGNLGQAVNRDRYHSLTGFVEKLQDDKKNPHWQVKNLAQTRSGNTVAGISKVKKHNDNIVAIFKDGQKRKLQEERESVAIWHQIYPGIAPKILSYNVQAQSAALLIEYLDGVTFESLFLKSSRRLQNTALKQLCLTLKSIWQTTRRKKIVHAHYMGQLKRRMGEVYRIHPDFKQATRHLNEFTVLAFDELIKQAQAYEETLTPCFSVYIHGDFNSDNIIYDPLSDKINFIDLHRSRYMDYVQDVSVFMVSNYRLQVLDPLLGQRVLEISLSFYQFVAQFAKANHDHSFELRLALGLARSFATSTRFILDKTLADAMFMRARYLIEQVLTIMSTEQTVAYRVPIKEIFLG